MSIHSTGNCNKYGILIILFKYYKNNGIQLDDDKVGFHKMKV